MALMWGSWRSSKYSGAMGGLYSGPRMCLPPLQHSVPSSGHTVAPQPCVHLRNGWSACRAVMRALGLLGQQHDHNGDLDGETFEERPAHEAYREGMAQFRTMRCLNSGKHFNLPLSSGLSNQFL